MRRLSMHSPGVQFFSFWGGGGVGVFFFILVPTVFPSCSHGVPIRFPKDYPSSQVVPKDVAQSLTLMYIN
jgi:hypothetical protein